MNRLPVDTSRSGWIVFLQLLHTVRAPCGIDPCGYGSTMTHWLHVEILDHPSNTVCTIKICGALRAIYSETHGRFLAGAHVPELNPRADFQANSLSSCHVCSASVVRQLDAEGSLTFGTGSICAHPVLLSENGAIHLSLAAKALQQR